MHIICLSAPSQNPRKDSCVTIEYIVMNSADKSCFLSLSEITQILSSLYKHTVKKKYKQKFQSKDAKITACQALKKIIKKSNFLQDMQILNNKLLRDSEAFHFNVLLYCHIFLILIFYLPMR